MWAHRRPESADAWQQCWLYKAKIEDSLSRRQRPRHWLTAFIFAGNCVYYVWYRCGMSKLNTFSEFISQRLCTTLAINLMTSAPPWRVKWLCGKSGGRDCVAINMSLIRIKKLELALRGDTFFLTCHVFFLHVIHHVTLREVKLRVNIVTWCQCGTIWPQKNTNSSQFYLISIR